MERRNLSEGEKKGGEAMKPEQIEELVEQALFGLVPMHASNIKPHVRKAILRAIEIEREESLKEGYAIGFGTSEQGCNGEYPFGDDNEDFTKDAQWIKVRDAAIRARETK
jgi:hypothetical protein